MTHNKPLTTAENIAASTSGAVGFLAAIWFGAYMFHLVPVATGEDHQWWGFPWVVTVLFMSMAVWAAAFALIGSAAIWLVEEKTAGNENGASA